jgi:hypothetical protein
VDNAMGRVATKWQRLLPEAAPSVPTNQTILNPAECVNDPDRAARSSPPAELEPLIAAHELHHRRFGVIGIDVDLDVEVVLRLVANRVAAELARSRYPALSGSRSSRPRSVPVARATPCACAPGVSRRPRRPGR